MFAVLGSIPELKSRQWVKGGSETLAVCSPCALHCVLTALSANFHNNSMN